MRKYCRLGTFTFIISFIILTAPKIFPASDIPSKRMLTDEELIALLADSDSTLIKIKSDYQRNPERAVSELVEYYRQFFAEHYFYDWRQFNERFENYRDQYPDKKSDHKGRAKDHVKLFNADTPWKLPFKSIDGTDVSAYQLRHLSRQHKSFDMALVYFYENGNSGYLRYFVDQVKSLNKNYFNDNVETGGNDVFENFRSGYRIFNWLNIHNIFLASPEYTPNDQLLLIKTLLYHGAAMYKSTRKFSSGNHHTKGLMSLALLGIMFRDIKGTEAWLSQAIDGLTQHLKQEVNEDGFQFERSVHYHKGDIDNYFYVYYLAKLNKISLPEIYWSRFESMFESLIKISYPNKTLPVFQDDTDGPWGEYNTIGSVITLASILFKNQSYAYLAEKKVPDDYYWFLCDEDIKTFSSIKGSPPDYLSVCLPQTGYYIMRDGWNEDNLCMTISAGLSALKPDHQHGDMLGITAYANGSYILPNYQVRYHLNDYPFFKNSLVKNVAIADSMLQGRNWIPNSGGSGFGKWQFLPSPKTLLWKTNSDYDVYIGTHNGYEEEISCIRKVIFIKGAFWIVKDLFNSNSHHTYQQVWQGHYTYDDSLNILRSTFPNGSGLDLIQLRNSYFSYDFGSFRGKGNVVVNACVSKKYNFLTVLYPFGDFDERTVDKLAEGSEIKLWSFHYGMLEVDDEQLKITGENIINKSDTYFVFDCSKIKFGTNELTFILPEDIYMQRQNKKLIIATLNGNQASINLNRFDNVTINGSGISDTNQREILPGSEITISN